MAFRPLQVVASLGFCPRTGFVVPPGCVAVIFAAGRGQGQVPWDRKVCCTVARTHVLHVSAVTLGAGVGRRHTSLCHETSLTTATENRSPSACAVTPTQGSPRRGGQGGATPPPAQPTGPRVRPCSPPMRCTSTPRATSVSRARRMRHTGTLYFRDNSLVLYDLITATSTTAEQRELTGQSVNRSRATEEACASRAWGRQHLPAGRRTVGRLDPSDTARRPAQAEDRLRRHKTGGARRTRPPAH